MVDVCMCEGYDCPKKNECYRFRAIPDKYRQAYFLGRPYEDGADCEHFIDVENFKGRRLRDVDANLRQEKDDTNLGQYGK